MVTLGEEGIGVRGGRGRGRGLLEDVRDEIDLEEMH